MQRYSTCIYNYTLAPIASWEKSMLKVVLAWYQNPTIQYLHLTGTQDVQQVTVISVWTCTCTHSRYGRVTCQILTDRGWGLILRILCRGDIRKVYTHCGIKVSKEEKCVMSLAMGLRETSHTLEVLWAQNNRLPK